MAGQWHHGSSSRLQTGAEVPAALACACRVIVANRRRLRPGVTAVRHRCGKIDDLGYELLGELEHTVLVVLEQLEGSRC